MNSSYNEKFFIQNSREDQNTPSMSICFLKIISFDTMSKNMVEQDMPQVTIQRMRIACWITKITDTHPEYVIIISFARQIWLRKRAAISCYTYIACLAKGQNETADGLSSTFRHS